MTSRPLVDTEAYREAKAALASELSEEVRSWSFSHAIEVLKSEISKTSTKSKARTFARHHIGLRGGRFTELIQWIKYPSTMHVDEISLVLRALQKLQPSETSLPEQVQAAEPEPGVSAPDARKEKTVAHFVTLLNSGNLLLDAHEIRPEDVFAGSRISIQLAMQQICKRFGIVAIFADPSAKMNEPMTRDDLVSLGLRSKKRRRV